MTGGVDYERAWRGEASAHKATLALLGDVAESLRWALAAMKARTPYADEGENFQQAEAALERFDELQDV